MATEIWVNIGSGNGLLPDGTKPLPEPMLTYHRWGPLALNQASFYLPRWLRCKWMTLSHSFTQEQNISCYVQSLHTVRVGLIKFSGEGDQLAIRHRKTCLFLENSFIIDSVMFAALLSETDINNVMKYETVKIISIIKYIKHKARCVPKNKTCS